jgi:hypothetical protein
VHSRISQIEVKVFVSMNNLSQHLRLPGVQLCLLFMLSSCALAQAIAEPKLKEDRMWMTVGEQRFAVTLDDSEPSRAFARLLPLILDMTELNANEKYASLPQRLPTSAVTPGTIRNGDLMLYGTDTLVIFYRTFESTYSYTRLGNVDSPNELTEALGRDDVTIHFSAN